MGQISYSLNDSIKLKELGVCTFGNDVKFNNLNDEFHGPLPDCRIGNYHLYSLEDSLYLLYPKTLDYCGASSYSCCSSYLIKPVDGYYIELDEIRGFLDVEKSNIEKGVFVTKDYYRTGTCSVSIINQFTIDRAKMKFNKSKIIDFSHTKLNESHIEPCDYSNLNDFLKSHYAYIPKK
ncbi:hypothetical protein N9I98_01050 [Flavobacteriales bacterium]|nr:hypothetical protein [Flavobacteriales bacterium]